MSYHVRTEGFEGPFDLLLYLVSRQRVDIGSVSVAQIADQYVDEVARMGTLDLNVASDFLLVASTLLEIKARSLLPDASPDDVDDEEVRQMAPDEARETLVDRLLVYKQFKNAASMLERRGQAAAREHARPFGPDASLLHLAPDYLEGVSLDDLGSACARALARRDRFLLDSEHIAAKPVPVEACVRDLYHRVSHDGRVRLSQAVGKGASLALVVAAFLAVLELYKRGMVDVEQDERFGDIVLTRLAGAEAAQPGAGQAAHAVQAAAGASSEAGEEER